MTYCNKLFEGLDRRLQERKTLDEIGKELCSDVKDPKSKVIRIIKEYKGKDYLVKNADWLGYNIPQNPEGKNIGTSKINEPKKFGSEIQEVEGGGKTENLGEKTRKTQDAPETPEMHPAQDRSNSLPDKTAEPDVSPAQTNSEINTAGAPENESPIAVCPCGCYGYNTVTSQWVSLKDEGGKQKRSAMTQEERNARRRQKDQALKENDPQGYQEYRKKENARKRKYRQRQKNKQQTGEVQE